MIKLDERLSACADYVRQGAKLADIGTDHAYLPVYLSLCDKISSAVACDIKEGPLEKAAETVQRFCADNVTVRLSDGLSCVSSDEADDIVMAGIGGDLTVKLIDECEWLKDPGKRLILQPMTAHSRVLTYLRDSLFHIEAETAVTVRKKHYIVICASYSGKAENMGELYPFIGLLSGKTFAEVQYIRKTIASLCKKHDGFIAKGETETAERLSEIIRKLQEKLEIKL